MTKEAISTISILTNFILGLLKVVLGLAAKSSALVAEGVHSGIDVFSSAVTFFGIRVAQKEPTREHPYGWGRAEVLSGLVVAALLALAGVGILREALGSLIKGEHEAQISLLPLLLMIVSVASNEVLARFKIQVGQKEESLALIADGKHSRVDVYSSAAALLGLGLARFFPIADSLTAILVGGYILYETFDLGKEIGENLLDVADLGVEEKIKEICEREQVDLSSIRSRKIGSISSAELEISLPIEVKISRADDLVTDLQKKLVGEVPRLEYVVTQIKGVGKRLRMLRGKCAETLERLGPKKQGRRVITPYRDGEPYEDFGAPEYLIVDYEGDREILREVVGNPYYKIGRGHGVRFAGAVQADEIRAINIGKNAKKALGNLGIKVVMMGEA